MRSLIKVLRISTRHHSVCAETYVFVFIFYRKEILHPVHTYVIRIFFLSVIYYFFLLIIKLPPAADGIVSACDEIHRHVTIITANGSRPGQVFTPAAADTGSESVK